jgi:hypothetical protein
MQVLPKISIDKNEIISAEDLDEAFRLIDGNNLSEDKQRPFRRIRGNDFTMADVQRAVAIVRDTAATRAKALNVVRVRVCGNTVVPVDLDDTQRGDCVLARAQAAARASAWPPQALNPKTIS